MVQTGPEPSIGPVFARGGLCCRASGVGLKQVAHQAGARVRGRERASVPKVPKTVFVESCPDPQTRHWPRKSTGALIAKSSHRRHLRGHSEKAAHFSKAVVDPSAGIPIIPPPNVAQDTVTTTNQAPLSAVAGCLEAPWGPRRACPSFFENKGDL